MENDNYVIIASLRKEPACKLINRIPGSRLLISSLPEACSKMRALGVLSSAFSLNAITRQGACKRSQLKSIGVSPENPRWLPNQ